ncbi:MAG: hypothetical protein WCF65_09180 [Parachlamydiaceae bacterium]
MINTIGFAQDIMTNALLGMERGATPLGKGIAFFLPEKTLLKLKKVISDGCKIMTPKNIYTMPLKSKISKIMHLGLGLSALCLLSRVSLYSAKVFSLPVSLVTSFILNTGFVPQKTEPEKISSIAQRTLCTVLAVVLCTEVIGTLTNWQDSWDDSVGIGSMEGIQLILDNTKCSVLGGLVGKAVITALPLLKNTRL